MSLLRGVGVLRCASVCRFGFGVRCVRTTTGQVGVPVVTNAREVLIGLYEKTLQEAQTLPPDAGYRDTVERITKYRLKVVTENQDIEAIETEINSGIVEELIEQAKDELSLIPEMNEWKPWEEDADDETDDDDDDNETDEGEVLRAGDKVENSS